MKKLFLLWLLICKSALFGQTVLTSFPLDLKKNAAYNLILNAENIQTHDVFVFATDKEKVSILKYSKSLFLTDQYTVSRLNIENRILIGYSFGEDGNPTLYWSSDGFKDIIVARYDLENKTNKVLKFTFPFESQEVMTTFQKNNLFHILAKDKSEEDLIVYTFKNGTVEKKLFDLSDFTFQIRNTQIITFNQLIQLYPIEIIDTEDYNPLYKSSNKSKLFILDNRIILTLDHNPKKTQVVELNFESHQVKEKIFTQTIGQSPKNMSNSFYNEDKLYQIAANKNELTLEIKDYNTEQPLKSIKVSKNDTIRFKNSPLFIQWEGKNPRELKNTNKFLQHLSSLNIGLSVFKNKENTLITLGGTPKTPDFSYADYLFYENSFLPEYDPKSVYFETAFDRNFEFAKPEPQPLAIDNLYNFLNNRKEIAFQNIMKFQDYYILGYYDSTAKQVVMRKFTDGFYYEERNPIINKAILSTPFEFEKP